ncbi:MAG: class IV adenylate cyclase [Anaerolineae bacterium]|nr:class IV adenylate cyclase [Anaerolineae bacterium]
MSNTQHRETEVKIFTPNLHEIREKLEQLGARLLQERVFELNVRYDSSDGSLSSRGIVLRLRQDTQTRLTYKSPGNIERGIVTREELEVALSDFDTMDIILAKLGYHPYMTYEKYRAVYQIGAVEVMLDELPYGNFIEVEGMAQDIEDILQTLGLHHAQRRTDSYTKLFDFVRHHLELHFQDLTFENFKDVDVPESAFIPPGSIVIE